MILELDDEEYSDLRAAVLLHFKGALRELAKTTEVDARQRLTERCDRLEQLIRRLGTVVPSDRAAPH
jgi:hypothetical protein